MPPTGRCGRLLGGAVELLVDEVAKATDGLAEQQGGREDIEPPWPC